MTYQLDPRFTREYINPADAPPYDPYAVPVAVDEDDDGDEFEPSEDDAETERRKPWVVRFLIYVANILLACVIMALVLCALTWSMRWYEPEQSSFMEANPGAVHQWVNLDHISRYPIAAAIALEDVDMGNRAGAFDIDSFIGKAQAHLDGQDVIGGSTIPQQLTKNLWLSEDRSAWRKLLEAGISMSLSFTVPHARIMELYVNYAQLGPKIYGVCAASWYYFTSPPWSLTEYQAAQLMAILPLPSLARRTEEGGIYVAGSPELEEWFYTKVYTKVPNGIAAMGGYRAVMDQVGIEGDASDHKHEGEGSCSEMPDDVRELLNGER